MLPLASGGVIRNTSMRFARWCRTTFLRSGWNRSKGWLISGCRTVLRGSYDGCGEIRTTERQSIDHA